MNNLAIGKAYPDRSFIETSERLLLAKLDLAPSREAQVDAMEEHWVRIRTAEDIAQTMFDVGKTDITGLAPIRQARLELEAKIERLSKRPAKK